MGQVTKDKSILLDKLISDCITFRLELKEALEYIGREYTYGFISERTYFRRRKKLLSDKTRDSWFSYFCRIGFVQLHMKLMQDLERQYDDTMHQLFVEEKTKTHRDEGLILKLKKEHREIAMMLGELSAGIPVISGIKAKLDKYKNGQNALGADHYFNESNPFYKHGSPT